MCIRQGDISRRNSTNFITATRLPLSVLRDDFTQIEHSLFFHFFFVFLAMEWDSLGRWFRNLLTVSAVALVLHEHIPKNAECFGTTYLMFLARKWMRIVKQTIMRVQVIVGMSHTVCQ